MIRTVGFAMKKLPKQKIKNLPKEQAGQQAAQPQNQDQICFDLSKIEKSYSEKVNAFSKFCPLKV